MPFLTKFNEGGSFQVKKSTERIEIIKIKRIARNRRSIVEKYIFTKLCFVHKLFKNDFLGRGRNQNMLIFPKILFSYSKHFLIMNCMKKNIENI